jgi:hypothetical protein
VVRGGGELWGEAMLYGSFFSPSFPVLSLKNKTKPLTKSKLRKIAIKAIK